MLVCWRKILRLGSTEIFFMRNKLTDYEDQAHAAIVENDEDLPWETQDIRNNKENMEPATDRVSEDEEEIVVNIKFFF